MISSSIAGAIAIGQYTEAGVVVVLFSIAELLERNVSGRASDAIAGVLALRPETAVLADTGEALCRFHVNLLCQISTWRRRRRRAGGFRVSKGLGFTLLETTVDTGESVSTGFPRSLYSFYWL